jgi:MFS family permease
VSAGARLALDADGWLILAGRALRSFAFGWLSVILALYLAARGFSAFTIGALLTATMVEDALLSLVLATWAARVGPAWIMAACAPLIALGGWLLASADSHALLFAGAVLGTLSPNGQEAGPFAPMEQALLPGSLRSGSAVRLFGWYNVCAFLPAALGAGAAGVVAGAAEPGDGALGVQRGMLLAYAAAGLVLSLLYVVLAVRLRGRTAVPAGLGRLGLRRSRAVVLHLAALQALDALAGGFIMQGLLAYWFHLRFGVDAAALGALFFGTSLLSAASFLVAARVAERFGLLNTMVFTHLPSNLLLMGVPFMPSFPAAAGLLLLRHLLSQMDVPTRQAYTLALVEPAERPAASGLTAGVRALAQACAPVVTGVTLASASALPFLLAGGLKSLYDLALFARFRRVPLHAPEAEGGAAR